MIRLLADPRFFPALIMALFACASVRYAFAGQWGHVAYHASAAVLNASVTFWMGAP